MESLPNRPPPARSLGEAVKQWLAWFGVIRLIVIVASVVGVGAGAYWLLRAPATSWCLRAPATPVENSLPFASTSSTTTAPAGVGADSAPPSATSGSATS